MMAVQSLSILGSTGSIGTQALDVAQKLGLRITGLAAGRKIDVLEQQVRQFHPSVVAVSDTEAAEMLRVRLRDVPVRVLAGEDGVCTVASGEADMVLNAVVGMAGLAPTIAAIEAKKTLALANKESLVVGGELVMRLARENGVRILPVDSEHSAIFQCLQGSAAHGEIKRLILTASGGPFFGYTCEQLRTVEPKQALRHPNWKMGAKITIDSATLINKGMELIEAMWLFDVSPEKIEVVVHRQSILHSAVEFVDHAVIAQLGVPDMRVPIQYAITWPHRLPSPAQSLDWFAMGALTFERPDEEVFHGLCACKKAARRGGLVPAALNGANEEAVALFLEEKISFPDIAGLSDAAADLQEPGEVTFANIIKADAAARRFVRDAARKPRDGGSKRSL
ncbi:MAG: 1-deoxy-D-xylulose-5-phosphate reductoisomerase [Ethanoligenens sp.]